ncbi:MAG: hypothetical protein DCC58_01065 [Chloroflexi bacterium]|nr:MAG: hypothetical protein DCC58_01065 [Chloroflexota bacterium]
MEIRCETNHRSLNGERTLTIRVHTDAPRNRARRVAEVHCNIPRDVHCHNDSVAAALMTLLA